jgi:alpha-beta hydrolase superfamily lysophospholipase
MSHVKEIPGRPTVVLVHGAFADSSSWNGVIERLLAKGIRVTALAKPRPGRPKAAARSEGRTQPLVLAFMTLSALRLMRSNSSFVRLPSLRCFAENRLALIACPSSGIG